MKNYKKNPDLNTKVGKYVVARTKGKTKTEAKIVAGYSATTKPVLIENTKTFLAIQDKYKDTLLKRISMEEIAEAHAENIEQDKDRGARNTAIKMAIDKIEPESAPKEEAEHVVVVLK